MFIIDHCTLFKTSSYLAGQCQYDYNYLMQGLPWIFLIKLWTKPNIAWQSGGEHKITDKQIQE